MIASVYGAHSVPAFHFVKTLEAMEGLTRVLEHQANQDLKGIGTAGLYR